MQKQHTTKQSGDIRSILVEVSLEGLPAAGMAEFKLGDIAQLKDAKKIISVEAFNTTLQTISPNQKVNMSDAAYKTAYLIINDTANVARRVNIPLSKLIRSNGNSVIEKLNMEGNAQHPNPLDPSRTVVRITDTSLATSAQVVLLEFTYE